MNASILNVSYPLSQVGCDSAGGAEQILSALDAALVDRGWKSLVIGPEGSRVRGKLISIPTTHSLIDEKLRAKRWKQNLEAIERTLREERVDLVHMHGVDFYEYLPKTPIPILVTLHLPLSWYPPRVFEFDRQRIAFNCVSDSQKRIFGPSASSIPVIENGIEIDSFEFRSEKDEYALCLGRICPEKGYHLALDAAHSTDFQLRIAGQVFPYPSHTKYFQEFILPRLDEKRRFLGPANRKRRVELLSKARCVVIPSLAPETSSLVAMEAMASGTPVIAFRSGALPEIVEDGVTGFLVSDAAEIVNAILRIKEINPAECRRRAEVRFSAQQMISKYFQTYRRLTDGSRSESGFTQEFSAA